MTTQKTSAVAPEGHDGGGLKKAITPGLLLLFIVGDILGTGVYALTGKVAGEVGGAGWVPVIIAFTVAMISALSYLEMVTKYPQAAGAALYVHKAFGIHVLTFMVTFAVLCSGITSASTASTFLADNFSKAFHLDWGTTEVTAVAIAFIVIVALVNLWGVGESVKVNVVLTLIELSGLVLVVLVGFIAIGEGKADFSRTVVFETPGDKSMFLGIVGATALAFFSMVGFEDSVNMAEETQDPVKTFPRMLIGGLSLTGVVYVLVSITAVAIVPVGKLTESSTPLLEVVHAGAPNLPIDDIFPFISMFAVANTALINMMMASRLLYGMARQDVLPRFLGAVLPGRRTPWTAVVFSTVLAIGLIWTVKNAMGSATSGALGGTTALLLLAVFALVNIAVLVNRRDKVSHRHFRTPSALPIIGAITSFALVGPWAQKTINYQIAGVLLGIGFVLWLITYLYNSLVRAHRTRIRHPEDLDFDRE
ncbi:APC family permease [Devriesea agamarum]|uniref:APC family permease n=1 Tax=Devriesea agamarum TaxID=472569 RepID=UPI00071C9BC8|nr:APC family permease [Devriesea agamarum]